MSSSAASPNGASTNGADPILASAYSANVPRILCYREESGLRFRLEPHGGQLTGAQDILVYSQAHVELPGTTLSETPADALWHLRVHANGAHQSIREPPGASTSAYLGLRPRPLVVLEGPGGFELTLDLCLG